MHGKLTLLQPAVGVDYKTCSKITSSSPSAPSPSLILISPPLDPTPPLPRRSYGPPLHQGPPPSLSPARTERSINLGVIAARSHLSFFFSPAPGSWVILTELVSRIHAFQTSIQYVLRSFREKMILGIFFFTSSVTGWRWGERVGYWDGKGNK